MYLFSAAGIGWLAVDPFVTPARLRAMTPDCKTPPPVPVMARQGVSGNAPATACSFHRPRTSVRSRTSDVPPTACPQTP